MCTPEYASHLAFGVCKLAHILIMFMQRIPQRFKSIQMLNRMVDANTKARGRHSQKCRKLRARKCRVDFIQDT